jgi:hypothetical protein
LLWRLIVSNASSAFDLCNAMLALPLPRASRLEVQAIYDMTIAPNGRRECKDCLLLDGLVEVFANSPLMRTDHSVMAGIGLAWVFAESKTLVHASP